MAWWQLEDTSLEGRKNSGLKGFGYHLLDNLIGIDDDYTTKGEAFGAAAGHAIANPLETLGAIEDHANKVMFEGPDAFESEEEYLQAVMDIAPNPAAPAAISSLALRNVPNMTVTGSNLPMLGDTFTMKGSDYSFATPHGIPRKLDPALNTPWSGTKHTKAPIDYHVEGRMTSELNTPDVVDPETLLGRDLFVATGDRTSRGRTIDKVGDRVIEGGRETLGGPRYKDDPNTGSWASQYEALKPKSNVFNAYEGELDPILSYAPMGERSGDFSKHMSEVYTGMLNSKMRSNNPLSDDSRGAITNHLLHRLSNVKSAKLANQDLVRQMPSFGSSGWNDWLLAMRGGDRSNVIKSLDTAIPKELGAPDVGEARFAITEPELVDADAMDIGFRMSTPQRGVDLVDSSHPSYSHDLPMVGNSYRLEHSVPWWIGFRDEAISKMNKPGVYAAQPKDIKSLMGNPQLRQSIDQQWVDEVSKYQELVNTQGKAAAQEWAKKLMDERWSK